MPKYRALSLLGLSAASRQMLHLPVLTLVLTIRALPFVHLTGHCAEEPRRRPAVSSQQRLYLCSLEEMQMQDSLKTLLAVTAAATLLAGTALAQSTSTSPSAAPAAPPTGGTIAPAISSGPPTTAAAPSASIESASDADVIGLPVKSSDSVKVGKIDNVLVSADGKVDKVVVAVGGILGIGTKDVMVNWKDLQIDGTQREAQVAMSEAELKNAPPFRRDDAAMDSGRSK